MKPDDLEVTDVEDSVEQEPVEETPIEAVAGPRLIVKRNGAETDESFPVNPPATIGRFDPAVGPIDVDLANIPESVYVSRKHARITQDEGLWMIEDLGSSNGTFLLRDDFERIEAAELEDGTEIALGNARFVFRIA
ncbi:MAG TPA: FHA domain-containing protein [Fimbriimonadaceae bacterium]|mgnify:CR=1 FL=1|nr:FHA domain-containing protein [Fimbriimonadaceae bacterium]